MKQFINKQFVIISLVIAFIISVVCGTGVYLSQSKITSLQAPLLKDLPGTLGGRFIIAGVGYPKAKVLIFYNGSLIEETVVNNDGNFSKTILITQEGKATFQAKQFYKNIESPFSESLTISIDLTAPSPKTFKLSSKVPPKQNTKTLVLEGSISPEDILVINTKTYPIKSDGSFRVSYVLSEGSNIIRFQLMDKYWNKSDYISERQIMVDSIPPQISSSYFEDCVDQPVPTKEIVNIRIEEWTGYLDSITSVPIVGCVKGKVSSITVDGKKITWDENGEIYQRIRLMVRGGLNKYKVVVTDKYGNKSTGYVETTSARTGDSIDVNINY